MASLNSPYTNRYGKSGITNVFSASALSPLVGDKQLLISLSSTLAGNFTGLIISSSEQSATGSGAMKNISSGNTVNPLAAEDFIDEYSDTWSSAFVASNKLRVATTVQGGIFGGNLGNALITISDGS